MSQGPQGPQGPQGAQGAASTEIDDQRVMGFSYAHTFPSSTLTAGVTMPDGGGPRRTVNLQAADLALESRQVAMALGEAYTLTQMHVALVQNTTSNPITVELAQAVDASDPSFEAIPGAIVAFVTGTAPDQQTSTMSVSLPADRRIVVWVISEGAVQADETIVINGSLVLKRTTSP